MKTWAVFFEGVDGEWWSAYEDEWPIRAKNAAGAAGNVGDRLLDGGADEFARVIAIPYGAWREALENADERALDVDSARSDRGAA